MMLHAFSAMTVSVVIPTLNEERVLPQTLPHTLALGFDEVTVVDGGSQDRTTEILASHVSATRACPMTLVTAPSGRACQMNLGAALSRGDVLVFLHADTLLPRNAKSQILQAVSDPDCVGGRFDVRFEPDAGWGWLISRMMNVRSRWTGIATGDQAIFVRRSMFEKLGGFSDITIMEDVDFTCRLKQAGRVAALSSHVVTSYRRWKTRGPIRTIVLMSLLRFLFWLGIKPQRLSQLYTQIR
jgi:rSAM/selenodomain-associated transferase 2